MFIYIVTLLTPQKQEQKPQEDRVKISLKEYVPPKKQEQKVPLQTQPIEIAPPMPKGSQLKTLTPKAQPLDSKKPIKLDEKKTPSKKVELNKAPTPIKPPKQEPKFEPLPPQKPLIELPKKEKKPQDEYSWLSEDRSSEEPQKQEQSGSNTNSINSNIKELYGDEFGKLSSEQQKYIIDNQEIMRRITQEVLNRVADVNLRGSNLSKNSINVIEFYLHPNGDMSDFRFLKKSGYYELDRTTQETIEFAYSRYPRPKEKTLIRYNVYYRFY